MKIQPIGDRILVKQATQEETTASGIILPSNAQKEKKAQAKIVALGNGEAVKDLGLKEGDIVVFGQYSGQEIEIEGEEYKILYVGREKDDSDVLAKVQ